MIKTSQNNSNNILFEVLASTSLIYFVSYLFRKVNFFNIFTFLIVFMITNYLFDHFGRKYLTKTFQNSLVTLFIMYWVLSISGLNYSVYEYDWNSFGIPINLNIDSDLYLNDLLANQEFPHIYIYNFISKAIQLNLLEQVFLIGFILQNLFFAKAFAVLKQNLNENFSYIIFLPLIFYPQQSGHFLNLPYFLPSILGFSISIYLISKHIFSEEENYQDLILFVFLIFVHPFWAIFTPLFLLIENVIIRQKKNIITFSVIFTISLVLNNLDGIAISEILSGDLINFYKSNIMIHFNWKNHYGFLFQLEINNLYQQISMILILLIGFSKKKIMNLNSKEEVFFLGLFLISLIIILGNYFHSSIFNEYLIATNFYRLGTITWFFTGIFIVKYVKSKFLMSIFISIPILFFMFSQNTLFIKELGFLNGYKINSKIIFLIISLAIVTMIFENNIKNNIPLSILLIGIWFAVTFYNIDKYEINNYLIKVTFIHLLLFGLIYFFYKRSNNKKLFLVITIFFLFNSSFSSSKNVLENLNLDYKTKISTQNINLIQENTDKKDVIIVDPHLTHFRKEVKRGILFSISPAPYNNRNLEKYLKYKSLYNIDSFRKMDSSDLINIIKQTNASDLILPFDSIALKFFKSNYEYIELKGFGYLFLNVNNF